MNETYLTADGLIKLKDELEQLKGPGREQLSARLKAAIEQGDLSENADYLAAKEEQGFLEGRIMELEAALKNAIIIDDLEQTLDIVSIGNTVTIQENGYPEEKYFVVGPKEANPQKGKISHVSPIGKAIIGQAEGDNVEVETPDGITTFKIIKIE